jgi:adenylate cyclase class 2
MEIEAKLAVRDHDAVIEALGIAGAEYVGTFIQTDRFFDFDDARLRKGDSALRLRSVRRVLGGTSGEDEDSCQPRAEGIEVTNPRANESTSQRVRECTTAPVPAVLTYKGAREKGQGGLKVREEIETLVEDAEAMAGILRAGGLALSLTVQKRRSSYLLGGCKVELDELPLLGKFVEVEGPDAATIHAVMERLGLRGETITKSYVGLLAKEAGELRKGAEFLIEG